MENFYPFDDKRPIHEIIRTRNQRQNERTDRVILETREFIDEIKSKYQFESAKASTELETGPLSKEQLDLVKRKVTGQLSHQEFLEEAKKLAREASI